MRSPLDGTDAAIEAALRSNRKKIEAVRRAEGKEPLELAADALSRLPGGRRRRRQARHRSDAEAFRRARKIQRLMQGLCVMQVVATLIVSAAADAPVLLLFVVIDGFGAAATLSRVQKQHALCTVFNLVYLLGSLGAPVALTASLDASEQLDDGSLPAIVAPFVYVCSTMLSIGSLASAAAATYVLRRPLMLYRYEAVAMDEETADVRSLFGLGATDLSHDLEPGLGSPRALGSPRESMLADGLQPVAEWVGAGEAASPLIFMPVKPKPKPAPPAHRHVPSKGAAQVPTLTPPPMASSIVTITAAATGTARPRDSPDDSMTRGDPDGTRPASGRNERQEESWLDLAEAYAAEAFGTVEGDDGEDDSPEGGDKGGGEMQEELAAATGRCSGGGTAKASIPQRLVLSDESESDVDDANGDDDDDKEGNRTRVTSAGQATSPRSELGEMAVESDSQTRDPVDEESAAHEAQEVGTGALPPPFSAMDGDAEGRVDADHDVAAGGSSSGGGSSIRRGWSGASMRGLGGLGAGLSGATGWSVEKFKQVPLSSSVLLHPV
eukprot:scaffold200614_cov26-Tisochrysis_lutea.AAC.3